MRVPGFLICVLPLLFARVTAMVVETSDTISLSEISGILGTGETSETESSDVVCAVGTQTVDLTLGKDDNYTFSTKGDMYDKGVNCTATYTLGPDCAEGKVTCDKFQIKAEQLCRAGDILTITDEEAAKKFCRQRNPEEYTPAGNFTMNFVSILRDDDTGAGFSCQVSCAREPEPVDCALGTWSNWTNCSQSCGGGFQYRSRDVEVEPMFGGEECEELIEIESCNAHACECEEGWTYLNVTRECYKYVKQSQSFDEALDGCRSYGGDLASISSAEENDFLDALGERGEDVWIGLEYFPQVDTLRWLDGSVLDYTKWDADEPSYYGSYFCGATDIYNSDGAGWWWMAECDNDYYSFCKKGNLLDCKLSSWSDWSDCSESCGGGLEFRTREVVECAHPEGMCIEELQQNQTCNIQGCPPPVDCVHSEWTEWTDCKDTCRMYRNRTIEVDPMHGGEPCEELEDEMPCHKDQCCICGLSQGTTRKKRVAGGTETETNEFPWLVGIWSNSDYEGKITCVGALISDRWFITERNCLQNDHQTVVLGEHDQDSETETTSLMLTCIGHVVHPYNKNDSDYTLALGKLSEPVDFAKYPHIRPICLTEDTNTSLTHGGEEAIVAGWGYIGNYVYTSSTPQQLTETIEADFAACLASSSLSEHLEDATYERYLCTKEDSSGPGTNDLGAPLIQTTGDGMTPGENYKLLGFFAHYSEPYAIYVKIAGTQEWIYEQIMASMTCPSEDPGPMEEYPMECPPPMELPSPMEVPEEPLEDSRK